MNPLEVRTTIYNDLVKHLQDEGSPVDHLMLLSPSPRKPVVISMTTRDPNGEVREYEISVREVDPA